MDQGNDISIPRQQTEVAPHKYKIGEYKYENTKTGIQIQKEEILIASYGSNDISIPGQHSEVAQGNAAASKYEIVVKSEMLSMKRKGFQVTKGTF